MIKKGSITTPILILCTIFLMLAVQSYDNANVLYYTTENTKDFLYTLNMTKSMKIGLRDALRKELTTLGVTKFKSSFKSNAKEYVLSQDGNFVSAHILINNRYKVVFSSSTKHKNLEVVYIELMIINGIETLNIVNK